MIIPKDRIQRDTIIKIGPRGAKMKERARSIATRYREGSNINGNEIVGFSVTLIKRKNVYDKFKSRIWRPSIDHGPAAVFRMSCVYGPHQFGTEDQGWVAHFMIRAMENRPITVYGDGYQVRDVLFVEDLTEALWLAQENMAKIAGRAFNIGGGPGKSGARSRDDKDDMRHLRLRRSNLVFQMADRRSEILCLGYDAVRPTNGMVAEGQNREWNSTPLRMASTEAWVSVAEGSGGRGVCMNQKCVENSEKMSNGNG